MAEIPTHQTNTNTNTDFTPDYSPSSYDAMTTAPRQLTRVSWGAIFAGAVCATAIMTLLSLMGSAIGFTSVNPATEAEPLSGVGTGAVIWYALSSIISLFVGGYVAARLAGFPGKMAAMMHGLTVWALATLLTLYLATSAIGSIIGTATSAVSSVASQVSSAAMAAGSAVNVPEGEQRAAADRVRSEAVDIARSSGLGSQDVQAAQDALGQTARDMVTTPGDLGADFNQLIDRMFADPDAVLSNEEQQALTANIAERMGVSEAEAGQIAARWQQEAGQTAAALKSGAASTAGSALDALAYAAWGAFIASLVGLLAAVFGAAAGRPTRPWMETHIENDRD